MAIRFLNSKEKKKILELLEVQFEINKFSNFHIIQDIDNIYMYTGEMSGIDLEKLKVSQIGNRIGIFSDGKILLTIQGAQIFGPHANKNIIELNDDEKRSYLKGDDLKKELQDKIYLIKSGDDFLGCSKVRNGIIRNNIEKARQINCAD